MSHYKPYPAYKDSGVEWLGQVPAHWEVRRLCYAVALNPPVKAGLPFNDEVSFLPMESIGTDGAICIGKTRPVFEVRSGYSYFEDGDVVFAKVTPCFENGKGAVMNALVGGVGFGTTELTVLRPNPVTDARFINFLLQSDRFRLLGAGAMTGAGGLKRVPDEFTRNFTASWPALIEQQMIADHLDRETVRVDGLISRKTRFIGLLREKRQALITHAVTKGLDPNAPRKDSGVEWLGDVPAHWKICGLTKYLGPIVDYRGRTPTKTDEGVFLVTARNIKNGGIDYALSQEFISESEYSVVMQRGLPEIGDVLFTMEAPLGEVANIDRVDIALAQRVVKFRGLPNVIDNYYLKYWIVGENCQSQLEQLGTGSTALGIKASKLGQIQFCFPSIAEQKCIVHHLDAVTMKIDTLISTTDKSIKLLKERRSALITAAVTGQIDLRETV